MNRVSHSSWASSKMPRNYAFKSLKWKKRNACIKKIFLHVWKNRPYTLLVQKAFCFDWEHIVCSYPQFEIGQITLCAHFHNIMNFMYTQMYIKTYTWHFCKFSTFNCFDVQIYTYQLACGFSSYVLKVEMQTKKYLHKYLQTLCIILFVFRNTATCQVFCILNDQTHT